MFENESSVFILWISNDHDRKYFNFLYIYIPLDPFSKLHITYSLLPADPENKVHEETSTNRNF